MENLVTQVEKWGTERGLATASPSVQSYKIVEEFGEMVQAHVKHNTEALKEEIGDVLVTIILNAMQMKVDSINYYSGTAVKEYFSDGLGYLTVMVASAEEYEAPTLDEHDIYMVRQDYKDNANSLIATLRQVALEFEWTLEECLQVAYNKIKGRKVKMVGDTLVKEEDLKEIN